MQGVKNKSKGEIINQIKFYLKKHCFVSQLFYFILFFAFYFDSPPECFVFDKLSGSKLVKRDVSKGRVAYKSTTEMSETVTLHRKTNLQRN